METFNWTLLLLRDNPFSISPPEDPKELVWAGMPELKNEIEQKLVEAKESAITQVILNRGPLGSGKTHAMLYYSLLNHWPRHSNSDVQNIVIIPVRTPKETSKADKDFYVDVLERLGMQQIRQVVTTALQLVGEQVGLKALQKITSSESLGQAICMLGAHNDVTQGSLFKTGHRSERELLLDAYFLDGCTKAELRKLGLARNIDKAQDRFRVLAGLLHCFTGLIPNRDLAVHSRICLWLDELEDLVYFTAAQYRPFTQGLRELIDLLPSFFSLLLNMTLSEPSELETIEILLGKPLVDRITDHVIFGELTTNQGIQYVQELMSFWRTVQPRDLGLSSLYPFEEEALRYLIDTLDKRTPRSVNKRCRNMIIAALRKQPTNEPGQVHINLDLVKSIARSELDREME